MKSKTRNIGAALLVLLLGILIMNPPKSRGTKSATPVAVANSGRGDSYATSPTKAAAPSKPGLPKPSRVPYPETFVTRTTNGYIINYSNIVISTALVDGPMERLIGSDTYEYLAKKDFEESAPEETYLRKIKNLIETESPGSNRVFSAVRLVYELRSDIADQRRDRFELEFSTNAKIGVIQADSSLSAEEQQRQIASAMNNFNARRIAQDVEERDRYERFLKHLSTLVGEPSEATLERIAAFDPQFAPRRLQRPPSAPP